MHTHQWTGSSLIGSGSLGKSYQSLINFIISLTQSLQYKIMFIHKRPLVLRDHTIQWSLYTGFTVCLSSGVLVWIWCRFIAVTTRQTWATQTGRSYQKLQRVILAVTWLHWSWERCLSQWETYRMLHTGYIEVRAQIINGRSLDCVELMSYWRQIHEANAKAHSILTIY